MSLNWEQVPGWFDWNLVYDEVALTTPPGATIVEVGVAFGRSLLYLANRVRAVGRSPKVKIVAVDPWVEYDEHHFIWHPYEGMPDSERAAYEYAKRHGGTFEAFQYNLRESGLSDTVDVMRMTSMEALQKFIDSGVVPHFVFVDAHHSAEEVAKDLTWWDAWGSNGPEWMAGHDYNRGSEVDFPGVWKTVDAKWGQQNVEWHGMTTWAVRRSHIERPDNEHRNRMRLQSA